MAEAEPKLQAAKKALNLITKPNIDEIRALGKPAEAIKLVLKACCIMVGKAPKTYKDKDNPKKTVEDYWATSVAWMSNSNKFFTDLKDFPADKIDPDIIDKIKEEFVENPEF